MDSTCRCSADVRREPPTHDLRDHPAHRRHGTSARRRRLPRPLLPPHQRPHGDRLRCGTAGGRGRHEGSRSDGRLRQQLGARGPRDARARPSGGRRLRRYRPRALRGWPVRAGGRHRPRHGLRAGDRRALRLPPLPPHSDGRRSGGTQSLLHRVLPVDSRIGSPSGPSSRDHGAGGAAGRGLQYRPCHRSRVRAGGRRGGAQRVPAHTCVHLRITTRRRCRSW